MEPWENGISAASPAYLRAFIGAIEGEGAPFPVEDTVVFKEGSADTAAVILPGSFLNVRYLADFASGMGAFPGRIIGLNYPGHGQGSPVTDIDSLHLADYAAAVYRHLIDLSGTARRINLAGHSLGTIMVQSALFASYAFDVAGRRDLVLPIRKLAILGGGPPRLGPMDYLATMATRLGTMPTVMQMAKDPARFVSPEGDMKKTLGGEDVYRDFVEKKLIYAESKAVMEESFLKGEYAFIPAKIVETLGLETLFAYAKRDYFVSSYSTRKAIRQWAARPLLSETGHSGMVLGAAGRRLGAACAEFFA
jgi:pimeloyl-ACP methyl ester carboxylesterase